MRFRSNVFGVKSVHILTGQDRIVRSVPEAWTSLRQVDAFEAASGGQSLFRLDDLQLLRNLLDDLIKTNYPA